MEAALRAGGVTGTPNAVNCSMVSLTRIDELMPQLVAQHRAKKVVQMKALVGFVRRLRRAQLAENWSEVVELVKDAGLDGDMKTGAAAARFGDALEVCRPELELTVGEVRTGTGKKYGTTATAIPLMTSATVVCRSVFVKSTDWWTRV